jgi:hypothetical protein
VDRPRDFDHQPAHAYPASVDLDRIEIADLFGERFHALACIALCKQKEKKARK